MEYQVRPGSTRREAPIAQLDRALPSEGKGQRFESSWVRHFGFAILLRFGLITP